MTVWGHETIHIVKDTDNKQWIVSTATVPHQHLVTIPWVDAFRGYTSKQAPDYVEALEACLSHPSTALTTREEREAKAALIADDGAKKDIDKESSAVDNVVDNAVDNVVDMKRWRRVRRSGREK